MRRGHATLAGREGCGERGKILKKLTRFQSLVPIRGFTPASQRDGGQSDGAVAARPHRCQREDERTYNTQNTVSSRSGVGTRYSCALAAFCHVYRRLAAAGVKVASFLSTERSRNLVDGTSSGFGLGGDMNADLIRKKQERRPNRRERREKKRGGDTAPMIVWPVINISLRHVAPGGNKV